MISKLRLNNKRVEREAAIKRGRRTGETPRSFPVSIRAVWMPGAWPFICAKGPRKPQKKIWKRRDGKRLRTLNKHRVML